jgi:hypothetical protein
MIIHLPLRTLLVLPGLEPMVHHEMAAPVEP